VSESITETGFVTTMSREGGALDEAASVRYLVSDATAWVGVIFGDTTQRGVAHLQQCSMRLEHSWS